MFVTLADNTKIYYNVNGEEKNIDRCRDVLIVLHGGPGLADHTLYVSFWSKLQTTVQVVFLDMRGHGRSDGHNTPEKWTLKQWGWDVYEFCQALRIKKPIVAGISFGGWVALSYATQLPDHAKALILCHTEAKVDGEIRKLAYARKAKLLGKDPDEITTIVQQLLDWKVGVDTKALYMKYCLPLYSTKPYTTDDFARCIQNPQVWDVFGKKQYQFDFLPLLHTIKIPVLVLTGEYDPEHPPAFSKAMVERLTQAKLVIMKGAGVPVYKDAPEEAEKVMQQFLEKC